MTLNPFASEFKPTIQRPGLAPLRTSSPDNAPPAASSQSLRLRPSLLTETAVAKDDGHDSEPSTSWPHSAGHADCELTEADLYDQPTASAESTPKVPPYTGSCLLQPGQ